jgi:hypothetical protein
LKAMGLLEKENSLNGKLSESGLSQ